MPLQLMTPDDLEPIRQLLAETAQRAAANQEQIASNTMQIASNTEGIQELKASISNLNTAIQQSHNDMVRMLTQFAEEAAADRQAIQDIVQAMFRNQSNGGGQA